MLSRHVPDGSPEHTLLRSPVFWSCGPFLTPRRQQPATTRKARAPRSSGRRRAPGQPRRRRGGAGATTRSRAITAWRIQVVCWAPRTGSGVGAGWLVMPSTLRGVRPAGQRGATYLGRGFSLQTAGLPCGHNHDVRSGPIRTAALPALLGVLTAAGLVPTCVVLVSGGWGDVPLLAVQLMLTFAGVLLWLDREDRGHAVRLVLAGFLVGVGMLENSTFEQLGGTGCRSGGRLSCSSSPFSFPSSSPTRSRVRRGGPLGCSSSAHGCGRSRCAWRPPSRGVLSTGDPDSAQWLSWVQAN